MNLQEPLGRERWLELRIGLTGGIEDLQTLDVSSESNGRSRHNDYLLLTANVTFMCTR